MIVYQDLLTEKDVASDSYPRKDEEKGAIIGLESKKITVGDDEEAINKAIGANESKEEAGEKMDESKDSVINIVHAHQLQKIEFKDFKEFDAIMKGYWKQLANKMTAKKNEALGLGADYKKPADAKAAAAAEKEAEGKLDKAGKLELKQWVDRIESFKARHKTYVTWITNNIKAKWDEFEFYLPNEGELGSCMVVPARWLEGALSPVFYLFADGVVEAKF